MGDHLSTADTVSNLRIVNNNEVNNIFITVCDILCRSHSKKIKYFSLLMILNLEIQPIDIKLLF